MTEPRTVSAAFRSMTEADTRVLSVFRVVFGLALAAYVAWTPLYGRLEAFFTDRGIYPIAILDELEPDHAASTWFRLVHTTTEARFAFAAGVLACLALAAGAATRVTSVLVLVFVTSMHHRAPAASSGAMAIANAFALFATFLPLGRHYSVDAWLARRRGAPLVPLRIRSIAMALVHVQLFVIYLFNVVHKHGETWRDGTAVHYVLTNTAFAWPWSGAVDAHAPLWLVRAMSYGTLLLEASIALAVISPFRRALCRRYAVLAIVALHAAFSALLDVGPFFVFLAPVSLLLLASEETTAIDRVLPAGATVVREPPIREARGVRALRESLASAALLLVVIVLRRDLGAAKYLFGEADLPAPVTQVASALGMTQRWSMFSSNPTTSQHRMLFVVELEDGRFIDTRTRREPDLEMLDGRPLWPDFYWQKADDDFGGRRNLRSFEALVSYVARRPEVDGYRGSPRVKSVEIHQISSTIPPRGGRRRLGSTVLFAKQLLPTPLPGRRF